MTEFLPEGRKIYTSENKRLLSSIHALETAKNQGLILEAPCTMCDTEHNMTVDLKVIKGIIPRTEGAIGIDDGSTRDIALISKVGKPVCFTVTDIRDDVAILSRKNAQLRAKEEYLDRLSAGDIIPARVTHLEKFGGFVDIGCGIPSMIPIDSISVSRINHPSDRFTVGDDIYAVVKGRDENHILLSHKELLGTWEENAALFSVGETVSGIVRSVEDYGIFIELTPNLAGLAELKEGIKPKLIIVNTGEKSCINPHDCYFLTEGRIDRWVYSTPGATKVIMSEF